MDYSQEEEGAAGQEHAVRTGVIFVRLHTLAILIPLYSRRGSALCLTVKGGGLPLRNDQIRGVLNNPGRAVFKPCTGPCEAEISTDVIFAADHLQFTKTYNLLVTVQTVTKPFERQEHLSIEMLDKDTDCVSNKCVCSGAVNHR